MPVAKVLEVPGPEGARTLVTARPGIAPPYRGVWYRARGLRGPGSVVEFRVVGAWSWVLETTSVLVELEYRDGIRDEVVVAWEEVELCRTSKEARAFTSTRVGSSRRRGRKSTSASGSRRKGRTASR